MKLLVKGQTSYSEYSDDETNDDSSYTEEDYQDMLFELGTAALKLNPSDRLWNASVSNFGWRHVDGQIKRPFKAYDKDPVVVGRTILSKILPDAECFFSISVDYRKRLLSINNAHHDAPTGGEIYTVKPLTLKEETAYYENAY